MFSKIFLVASLLFFLFGANAFAHTHLEKSNPNNETVPTESFHDMVTFTVVTSSANEDATEVSATETSKNGTKNAVLLTKKAQSIKPSLKDYVLPVSIGLIIIIGFGSYWLIYRRKNGA